MQTKARVFIGSSVEGLSIAEHIQLGLDYHAECTLWSQGVFGLSGGTLESLLKAAKEYDFAVLVLTPDDLVQKRSASRNSPRDNVLFELGLFMGALGRERTYIVYCRDVPLDLPTDLAGVTPATFAKRIDSNLEAALGAVCTKLKTAMGTHVRSDAPATGTSKLLSELSSLKNELAAQRDCVHRLLESMLTAQKPKLPDAPADATLLLFEGAWEDLLEGSKFYVKICSNEPRCVYSYGPSKERTAEIYGCQLLDNALVGRFRWFESRSRFSGHIYFRPETKDRLVGEWWFSEAIRIERADQLPTAGEGTEIHLVRRPNMEFPKWAIEYFREIQKD